MFNKGILSWPLMPGMLCVLSMREGFVVRKRFRMFLPLVGSIWIQSDISVIVKV